jgi:hypothetical protein
MAFAVGDRKLWQADPGPSNIEQLPNQPCGRHEYHAHFTTDSSVLILKCRPYPVRSQVGIYVKQLSVWCFITVASRFILLLAMMGDAHVIEHAMIIFSQLTKAVLCVFQR